MNNKYFFEKYISGSKKSLNKLINLFFYAKMNIKDFMMNLESYQKYFAEKNK